MGRTLVGMPRCQDSDDSWQVRVCDNAGNTLGAGVLLGDSYVLTCAHVARYAGVSGTAPGGLDARLWIESVLCLPQWRSPARVAPDCWISERQTRHGDVTLLAMDTPVTCHPGARLLRAPARGPRVSVCGFPRGANQGIRAEGVLVGAANDGAWVEIHAARNHGQWITRGYSGAGVVDDETRLVVGIVMAAIEPRATVAYMMPAEAILSNLPLVGDYVQGGSTSDPIFSSHSAGLAVADAEVTRPEVVVDAALRQEIGRLFTAMWSGTAVITGGDPGRGTPWLARLVATADPATRETIPDQTIAAAPPGAVLGVGAIDLAIDAADRSVQSIRRRIAERFGIADTGSAGLVDWLLHREPPPALVIDRVDSAAEVDRLLGELLAPLAARASRRRLRLALGFTGPPPRDLDCQVWLGPEPVTGAARGTADPRAVRSLLAELGRAEGELAPLHAGVSARVAGAPGLPRCRAPWLRVRYAVSVADELTGELAQIGHLAEERLMFIRRLTDELRQREREHTELGLALDAYLERATGRFSAEDKELSVLYGEARGALRDGPCDIDAARAAVDTYIDAIRRRERR